MKLEVCFFDGSPISPPSGTQTAANGDELYSMMVGYGDDKGGYYQEYIYTGGTRRFENATGSIKLYMVINDEYTMFSNHGVGTITY